MYNERTGFPLADAALADLNSFSWPAPSASGRVQGLAEQAQKLSCETDVSLVAGHLSTGIFQDCWNLRGIEQFMVDLVADPNFAHALLDKVTQIHIGMWQNFLDVVGDHVDIVETADDLGTQNSLLISPRVYRKMIKPYHAVYNAAIREKTGAKIFFHSCGMVMPLIEDLIETGVDILNPIQPLLD